MVIGRRPDARRRADERRHPERHRHHGAITPGVLLGALDEATEGLYLGAAEFVDGAGLGLALGCRDDGRGDVAHVHGLELGAATADQRQHRPLRGHGGEAVEELVLGPEDDRGAQDDRLGEFGQHGGFALGLGAAVATGRIAIGADGGDVDEMLDAGGPGGFGDGPGALDVDGLERLATRGDEHTDEIDGHTGAVDGAGDRVRIAEVGLDGHDLADAAHGLQVPGEIGAADGSADAPAFSRERTDGVAPDESRAAEHRRQRSLLPRIRHGLPLPPIVSSDVAR